MAAAGSGQRAPVAPTARRRGLVVRTFRGAEVRMVRIGLAGLEEDIGRQVEAMRGRSPASERVLSLLPAVLNGRAGRFVDAAWEHRRFLAWYERPLLLLAALRADALGEGPGHPLFGSLAAETPDTGAVTFGRIAAVLDGSREGVFEALAHRDVHTDETSHAIAWLWPAALARAGDEAHPLALAGVGARAGLTLVADALPPAWVAVDGSTLELSRFIQPVTRLGLDPAPLDPLREPDGRWLRACIWTGDRTREARLTLALEALRAARVRPDAPVLVPIEASNVPARLDLLSGAETGALVLAYQAAFRDRLLPGVRAEYEEGMRQWLGTHPPGLALWVELEPAAAGLDGEYPAVLVARVRTPWNELRELELARCDLLPRRLEIRHAGVAELRSLLRAEVQTGLRP